jgi:hypothetical protein
MVIKLIKTSHGDYRAMLLEKPENMYTGVGLTPEEALAHLVYIIAYYCCYDSEKNTNLLFSGDKKFDFEFIDESKE